jgi:hypothetical protein
MVSVPGFARASGSLAFAAAITLAWANSLANLIFGSLPDHFAVANCLLLALLLLAVRNDQTTTPPWRRLVMLLVEITVISVSSIHAVAVFLLNYGRGLVHKGWWHSGVRAALVTAAITVPVVASGLASRLAYYAAFPQEARASTPSRDGGPVPNDPSLGNTDFIKAVTGKYVGWFQEGIVARLLRYPVLVGASFIYDMPDVIRFAANTPDKQPAAAWSYQHHSSAYNVLAGVVFVVVALAILAIRRRFQAVAVMSGGLLVWNWCFHTFYGTEIFLYAGHWMAAAFVPLALWLMQLHARSAGWRWVLYGGAVLIGAHNLAVWHRIVAQTMPPIPA